ncbi:MAG: hypothetical protein A2Y38_21090 [Spirochaetes bacterium GWB1_59_5]|nr:MAG: hypothetical protein A2Y38_21090 [Spirochaetes bacterium GWB1_59_5]
MPRTPDSSQGVARLIGCGIFKNEFKLLPEALQNAVLPTFMDSMLHMDPARLDGILSAAMISLRKEETVLAFGDCCPYMREIASREGVARTPGVNCCEIYLGQERYRQLRSERVFFLMPEWATRWKHIFITELGLHTKALARDFMAQSMRRAVYIDTGAVPVPVEPLAEFSEYTGLEVTIERTGPEHFAAALESALKAARKAGFRQDGGNG